MLNRNKCLSYLCYSGLSTRKVIKHLEVALQAAPRERSNMESIRGALERARALHDEIANLYDEVENFRGYVEATATEK